MVDKENPIVLTPSLEKEIVNLMIEAYHKEDEKQREVNRDSRLHNTKLLLERYRSFSEHSKCAIYDANHPDEDEQLHDLMELMGCDTGLKVESIRASVARTRILIDHIDRMLDCYGHLCEKSRKPATMRRYRVIKALYIDEDAKSSEEMANAENVDIRTIQSDIQTAVEEISTLLFGYFE